jgi:copper chaperone CopZ
VFGTVTLVNRVSASVRVENCPTCASTLEAALKQRLSAVDISVSVERQTVDLEFTPSSPFASVSFRQAVKQGGAEVQRVDIEACGTIDTVDGQSWIKSGSTRLLLDGSGPFVTGAEVCVTGELQDQAQPPRLVPGKRINAPS